MANIATVGEWEGFLTHLGFIVPVATVKMRFGAKYNDFLKKLTLTHYQKIGPPKYARMYKFADFNNIPCILLPRTLIKTFIAGKILNKIEVLFAPMRAIRADLKLDLYANQILLIDYLCENVFTPTRITDGSATAILNLRAGMGKSYVAGGFIARRKVRTLCIVPKRPLAVQMVKDLRACFYPDDGSQPPITIGLYGKKVKKSDPSTVVANQDITVIVINSALSCDSTFFSGYSCVVLDEVHMYCSEQRREIFRKSSSSLMLGMSATTEDRTDGFDPISHKELAFDGIIRAENVPGFTYEDVIFRGEVSAIYYNGPSEYTQSLTHASTGRVFTPYMIEQFLIDPYRMKLAIRELRALYDWRGENDEQHCIYVFCEERDPLKKVFEELKKSFGDIEAPELTDVGEFIGGIKDEQVTKLKTTARILLTTYGYSGTGVSIDKMTAILFLTPRRAQMKQIIPRILRRGGNRNIIRRVIDIIDNKTPMKYQYGDRALAYEFYGMNVTATKIQYGELI